MCLPLVWAAIAVVSADVPATSPQAAPPVPPRGPWRCWAQIFGQRRTWDDTGTRYKRIDERCCACPEDPICWFPPLSHTKCCLVPQVLPLRCNDHSRSAGRPELDSPCASLDELGQWFAVSPPWFHIHGADKHSHFHDFYHRYERVFKRFGHRAKLLEIGVKSGNSLAVWGAWFPRGWMLGADIELETFYGHWEALRALGANTSGNIHVVQGDVRSEEFVSIIHRASFRRNFHVVIDDCNHSADSQILLFEKLFPTFVAPGGLYVIEDAWDIGDLAVYFNKFSEQYITMPWIGTNGDDGLRAQRQKYASWDWKYKVVGVSFYRHMVVVEKYEPSWKQNQ